MNANELCALIAKRHPSPEYAVFYEVSNATGRHGTRRADAVALGIWPSRGLALHGFEIKVSRRDWTKEKRTPQKAEAVAQHCDYWWIVALEGVVPVEEVPEGWGLLVPRKTEQDTTALYAVREAPKREAPFNVSRSFVAAMLRKVGETTVAKAVMEAEIERLAEERVARKHDSRDRELKRAKEDNEMLRDRIAQFEEASGVKLDKYAGPKIQAEAFRVALSFAYQGDKHPLEGAVNLARAFVRDYEAILAASKKA